VRHDEHVRDSFGKQVSLFTGTTSPFAGGDHALERWGPLEVDDIVLDVACGAAHVAEQLAPHVRQVVGVDLTPALLEVGARRLHDASVGNVLLQEGDAAALPFVDESFDVVVCRGSLHHFGDVDACLLEMRRVCRAGGRVAIDELIQPPSADAPTRDRYDALHRLLDPSHVRARTDEELHDLLTATIGPVTQHAMNDGVTLPLEIVVTDASDADRVWRTIEDELAGGPATGFDPVRTGETIEVTFRTATFHVSRRRTT
jgi:ubiquinone/menaquinone biosynthesis C-methylase UbiE